MSSLVLGSIFGGGGGVSKQPLPPAFRGAAAQAPQIPGVQAQQTPIVNTGAKQQAPQVAQDPKED